MTEKTLTVRVSPALHDRLTALAERLDQSPDAVLIQALEEFADHWEEHLAACDALESGSEDRVLLHVVNE